MNEDFVPDVRLDLAGALDDLEELLAGALVVSVVCIDHVDEGSAVLDARHRV